MSKDFSLIEMISILKKEGMGDPKTLAFLEKMITVFEKKINDNDSQYVKNLFEKSQFYKNQNGESIIKEINSIDENNQNQSNNIEKINQSESLEQPNLQNRTSIDVSTMNKFIARGIIDKLRGGQPPSYGIRTYSVGLESVLSIIDSEQIELLEHCGSSFMKIIEAPYGSGKTHFIYQFRELTMTKTPGFANVLITLDNKSTSIKDLAIILIQIFQNIEFPKTIEQIEECISNPVKCEEETGFIKQLRIFFEKKKQELQNQNEFDKLKDKLIENVLNDSDNPSFSDAIIYLIDGILRNDFEIINDISNFLQNKLDNTKMRKYNLRKITDENAMLFLKSLIRFLKNLGYSGLVISFDENEVKVAMNDKNRRDDMKSIHTIFDSIYTFKLNNLIVLYSVPDKSQIVSSGYNAMISRVSEEFSMISPGNPWLNLEKIVKDTDDEYWKSNLRNIGRKIQRLYERGNEVKFDDSIMITNYENITNVALKFKRGEIANKRSFIQKIIRVFDELKLNPSKIFSEEDARNLFTGKSTDDNQIDTNELKDEFENG